MAGVSSIVSTDGPSPDATWGRPPRAVLEVTDLTVRIPTEDGVVEAVRGVSFAIASGEVLGIVGESGSGKSMTALAIMGLLPNHAEATGSIRYRGEELLGRSRNELRHLRGNRLAMVFQDPMTALNPMYSIGWQVAEVVRLHHKIKRDAAMRRAEELLDLVGLPRPATMARQYPHQLSGGMRQRVMVAMAVANKPDVIVADEPTTALDVTIQAQLLELLATVRAESGAAMILITHDLGVVAGVADQVMVMYAGLAAEHGSTADVFSRPTMPYTRGLLASIPRLDDVGSRLQPIPGVPPSMIALSAGCAFVPRCEHADELCAAQPSLVEIAFGHRVSCHHPQRSPLERPQAPATPPDHNSAAEPLLVVRSLAKQFRQKARGWGKFNFVDAVSGIDLDLRAGETLGLVGESGCGKSTTARLLLRLEEPSGGTVTLGGLELTGLDANAMRLARQRMQMVFQDPYASLNPRLSVQEIIAEPLIVHGRTERAARVRQLLAMVGLDPTYARRFPHEFSGGQRQRIGIARALALDPEVLVLDEPVSALDVSVQASILNLLMDLRDELDVAYLFIAHDLSVVRHIADRLAVMYMGRIVETGTAGEVYDAPAHPYTKALMSAVPIPDPTAERQRRRILLEGEVPSPIEPPSGCRFRTRCWKADEICATVVPPLEILTPGRFVACHHPEEVPQSGVPVVVGKPVS
ncbi:MAG: ABC transporter ATP-binding protein [Ilumatobacteraceae bacterium]